MIANNVMQKGPRSENWGTAIHIAGKSQSAPAYRISNNRFRSDNPHEVAFVRNETMVPAILEGNRLGGGVVALVAPARSRPIGRPAVEAAPRDRAKTDAVAPGGEEPAAGPQGLAELEAKLRMLKRLYEEDLISQDEYTAKKAQLLKGL